MAKKKKAGNLKALKQIFLVKEKLMNSKLEGPFVSAFESSTEGVVKQELTKN